MDKKLRQECEALSLELFGNKNFYRRVEKHGLKAPLATGQMFNIKLSDDEVLAFLVNYKNQKDKHELSQKETVEPV